MRPFAPLSALSLMAVCALGLAQTEAQPVFRAGVSMVRVDALVLDGKRPITGLAAEDFRIVEEGSPVMIDYFGRDSEPIWLLLLLDVSGSMSKRLNEMAAVARTALKRLGPEDHVSVMLFGRRTKLAAPFTLEREPAAQAIADAPREKSVGAGTAMNSAIIDAAQSIRASVENQPGRRAIVVLTDNSGLNFQSSDDQTLSTLFGADTVLNAIVTPDARPPEKEKGGRYLNPDFSPSDVFLLARETGGEVLRAERAGDGFQQMLERVRTRYSLHYRPPADGASGVRRIKVELSPAARQRFPKAEVRARTGYAAP